MSHIYLCFLWHMHQPFYKDLASGEYKLPWTRMHALKDYYGMVRVLEEFPHIRQTFNLVPSMMAQVEEYESGQARDPFLDLAAKPAESLTDADRAFLLRHSFYSDPDHMIRRYSRYGQLYDAWRGQHNGAHFSAQDFRGNILTNTQNGVIHLDLEFYQPQPLLPAPEYYKLETSVTRRVPG